MQHSIAKGTFDVLPFEAKEEDKWRESSRWLYLEEVLRKAAGDYGYQEIRTPIFESTELFVRSVGESSDIVMKEMYTFTDRAERSLTLRPEGTAAVMRSFVEKKLHTQPGLHKFYYIGPMFRYERPQAGRYRQFQQFGIETVGIGTPEQDVELIDMACEIFRRLGLKNLKVQINSVGDAESRKAYKDALKAYLTPFISDLSNESKARLEKNVLRILDSKDPKDQKVLENAPLLTQFLTADAKEYFDKALQLLHDLKISYTVNPKLVRGLDYYVKTVFEITTEVLGAQNAICAGGRFDGLTEAFGGPHLPAAGFAIGIERVLQIMLKQKASFPKHPHPFVFFIPIGEEAMHFAFQALSQLRHEKVPADIDLSGKKIQHGLQLANELNAVYALIIGDEELSRKAVKLKHMATRESIDLPLEKIVMALKEKFHV